MLLADILSHYVKMPEKAGKFEYVMDAQAHMCQCIEGGINAVKVRGSEFTADACKVYTFMTI